MKRALIFDTETSGLLRPQAGKLEDQPRIIEFAVVNIELEAGADFGTITGEATWLIYPQCEISEEITRITKLTNEDLKGKPTFAKVLPEIIDCFLGVDTLIAHNLPFDRGMLVTELQRIGKEFAFPYPPEQICTVAAFEALKGRRMKMTELYEDVCGEPLEQTHRALDDARALARIVIKAGVLE